MRAAIYARYSTDMQDRTSIEDQARGAQRWADQHGETVVAVYSDEELSGSVPVAMRAGGKSMLDAARANQFDTLIIEDQSRLARDFLDAERTVRILEQMGIRIIMVSDGYDSRNLGREMQRGFKALMNQQYLRDLAAKTHRGLEGQLARGYSAGGKSYGYTTVPDLDANGEARGHWVKIDAVQAEIVREIFQRCADGQSSRTIADALNTRRVPSPRGGTWAVSALYGSVERGLGILNNELYIGRLVWNKLVWHKNYDTGKRFWRPRPKSEWQVRDRPDLRIIKQPLWLAVRARLAKPRAEGGAKGSGPPPKTLFGGLLRCGHCGGSVIAVSSHQYGCAARKDRGLSVCQGVAVSRTELDKQLSSQVRALLSDPSAIAEYERQVKLELAEQRRDQRSGSKAARARAAELDGQIERLAAAIAQVGISAALAGKLREAEAERRELVLESAPEVDEAAIVARLVADYRSALLDLQRALERPETRDRARVLLQSIIGPVVLTREGSEVWAAVANPERSAAAGSDLLLEVVAGAGFGRQKRWRVR